MSSVQPCTLRRERSGAAADNAEQAGSQPVGTDPPAGRHRASRGRVVVAAGGGIVAGGGCFPDRFLLSNPALAGGLPDERVRAADSRWAALCGRRGSADARPAGGPDGLALVELGGEQPFRYLVLAEGLDR